jgi:hypothetical protein
MSSRVAFIRLQMKAMEPSRVGWSSSDPTWCHASSLGSVDDAASVGRCGQKARVKGRDGGLEGGK